MTLRYWSCDSDVVTVLRQGGGLPELRKLNLTDEQLLAALKRLEDCGVVDSEGRLIDP